MGKGMVLSALFSVFALICAADDCSALRAELRAFYPDWGQGENDIVKDPRQAASYAKIEADLVAYCAAHPDYDALDVRRECYLSMRRHFVPFLFRESPFYFEAGVNGGWGGKRPGRLVNGLCSKFYRTQNLIPDSAFTLLGARSGQNLALCCGPFSDDMHHVPPFRVVLEKGFGGIRAEVAEALAKCPKDDPLGRKELETALVGFDTIREIQLSFAESAREMAKELGEGEERKRLLRIVEASSRCPWEPPKTFFEGLNTLWFVREIVGYVDGVNCFSLGRPDAWLIDLYRREIAAGALTEAEARELVAKFLVTADCHFKADMTISSYNDSEMEIPMSLGGCDKDGNWVDNELTTMFFDAHLKEACVFPKLHARISANAPKAYLEKIGDMLMKGHAVFTLLNDDRASSIGIQKDSKCSRG